ncbi:MAG: PIG-L deacetylase family protein [Hyphomicrobium sp.]|jgi:LmbE family N-acetylglucosaminyl deacetylase
MGLRQAARALIDARLRRLSPLARDDWQSSAMVIAPHPDDETLGCGGTIRKKIAAGVPVSFVFVTDGGASHSGRVTREELRHMREAEAHEAVRRLGGAADSVSFLRYPDSDASAHIDKIAADIARLLRQTGAQSVFVPHAKDPPADHAAVHAATIKGIRAYGRPVTVYEYPIWYWYHWPWVRVIGDMPGMWRTATRQTFRARGGLDALFALNRQAYVGDVLDVKRAALAAHASQTRRPDDDADWITLDDLAGGEFVGRLMSDYETFHRYQVNA